MITADNFLASRAGVLYGVAVNEEEHKSLPDAESPDPDFEILQNEGRDVSVTELEQLMNSAARRIGTMVSEADISAIQSGLAKARCCTEELKTTLKGVKTKVEETWKAMEGVRNLTVSEIVNAYNPPANAPKGYGDDVRAKLEGLLDKLADVSVELGEILQNLPAKCPKDQRHAIEELMLQTDMRRSEYMSFLLQMNTLFADSAAAQEKPKADPEGPKEAVQEQPKEARKEDPLSDWHGKMLNGKFGDLTKGMAAGMHGNYERIRGAVSGSEALMRVKEWKDGKETTDKAVRRLSSGLRSASAKVRKLMQTDSGVYGGFVSELANRLDEINGRLNVKTGAVDRVVRDICDASPILRILATPRWAHWVEKGNEELGTLMGFCRPLLQALRDYASGKPTDRRQFHKIYEEFLQSMEEEFDERMTMSLQGEMLEAMEDLKAAHAEDVEFCRTLDDLKAALDPFGRYNIQASSDAVASLRLRPAVFTTGMNRIDDIRRQTQGGDDIDPQAILSMLNGDFSLVDQIEMGLHGVDPRTIVNGLCDNNLIGETKLGSGAVNAVSKLTYALPDGSIQEVVFKPEQQGAEGLSFLQPGGTSAYGNGERVIALNSATHYIAEQLGCPGLVPKIRPLIHNGHFGLAMDVAKGFDMQTFVHSKGGNDSSMTAWEVWKLLDSKKEDEHKRGQEIAAGLLQQATDLSWLDLLCGQSDRHMANYFVNVDRATGKTTVLGIDNDMSFPRYKTGLTKFTFRGESAAQIKSLAGPNAPGVTENGDEVQVDVSKAPCPVVWFVQETKGQNSFAKLPAFMSYQMYKSLHDLNEDGIAKIRDSLGKCMSKKCVDSAILRLRELKEVAEDYEEKGKVIGMPNQNRSWTDDDVIKAIRANEIKFDGVEDVGVLTRLKEGHDVYLNSMSSDYCNRDLIRHLFELKH